MPRIAPLLLSCLLLPALPATAVEVFRCVDAQGRIAFQAQPCPAGSRQTLLHLGTPPPAQPVPALPRAAATPAPVAPPPSPPALPLPQLYACINASNGKHYLSRDGDPQPYLAPLGVLGVPSLPLARAYGPGGIGVSAPGAGPPPQVASRGAGYYTWVQDRCTPLPPQAICTHLQTQLDALQTRIAQTFQFDRPPLQQQAHTLRAQLQNCR